MGVDLVGFMEASLQEHAQHFDALDASLGDALHESYQTLVEDSRLLRSRLLQPEEDVEHVLHHIRKGVPLLPTDLHVLLLPTMIAAEPLRFPGLGIPTITAAAMSFLEDYLVPLMVAVLVALLADDAAGVDPAIETLGD